MMPRIFLLIHIILSGTLSIFMAGCATTEPSRFYALSPMPATCSETQPDRIKNDISFGIGPIKIPDYLDRPQIVTRGNQNEITLAEFDRWAGQLKDNLLRILSENLSILLATDRISLYPWTASMPIDYQIVIEVIQFDGMLGGDVTLVAIWSVVRGDNNEVLVMKKASFIETAGAQSYAEMVAAQSRALESLSREISSAILATPQKTQ